MKNVIINVIGEDYRKTHREVQTIEKCLRVGDAVINPVRAYAPVLYDRVPLTGEIMVDISYGGGWDIGVRSVSFPINEKEIRGIVNIAFNAMMRAV